MPTGATADIFRVSSTAGAGNYYDVKNQDGSIEVVLVRKTAAGYVPLVTSDPTAGPAVTGTRFGACVPQFKPGTTTTAGSEADIIAKFGQKAMIRKFNSTPTNTPPPKTTGASGNHASWSFGIAVLGGSPTQAQIDARISSNNAMAQSIINGTYDTQIATSVANLDPAYWFVEILHELDTKVNGGWITLANGQQLKDHAYKVIKSANSDLNVVATYQAYGFADTNTAWSSGTFTTRYGSIPHDVIGLDFDGIATLKSGTGGNTGVAAEYVLPYPTLQGNRMQNAQQWVRNRSLVGWSVPEWGTLANAVIADANNQVLADTFINYLGQQWLKSTMPPLYACWYDYGPNPEAAASVYSDLLSQPASIGAMKTLVASYQP